MPNHSWFHSVRRIVLALILGLTALPFLAGCSDSPDQKEIRANWARYHQSIGNRGGLDYYDLISKGRAEYYDRLVKLAAGGSKADVAALAPVEKAELLVMRNRVPASKLKTMDGRSYILHAISERYWTVEESDPGEPGLWEGAKIAVNGDVAIATWVITAQVEVSPRLSRRRMSFGGTRDVVIDSGEVYFVKQDGAWRVDELAALPGANKALKAACAGTTIEKYLIEVEAEESGKPVRDDIFDRPPR